MGKDPAFLFYPGDWLGGTMTFSRLHKGAYMDLLMAQFNQGHMSIEDIKIVLGNDFDIVWTKLKDKFEIDKSGLFFNERLEIEQIKRKNYTKGRKDNLASDKKKTEHMDSHMGKHMENEDVNRNVNVINKERVIESSNEPTIDEVKKYFKSMGYPVKDGENFYSYYSAQGWETTSGMNIRKTWHKKVIGWMNNQKQFTKYPQNERPPEPKKELKCHCGKDARLWSGGVAGCSYEHILEAQKTKKE